MKVAKKIALLILLCVLCGVVLFSLVFYSYQKLNLSTKEFILARKMVESNFNLTHLTHECLLNPTNRIKTQWDTAFIKFRHNLEQLQELNLNRQERQLTERIATRAEAVKYHFSLVASRINNKRLNYKEFSKDSQLIRLTVADLHQMAAIVFSLESIFRKNFTITQKKVRFWFVVNIFLFFSIFIFFIYWLFKDIQYRDKTQRKLAEVNKRLRLIDRLVEFTGDGVYRYRYKDSKILFANQGFVNILELGCKPEQIIGKKLEQVIEYLEPRGKIRELIEAKGSIRDYPYHFKTIAGKEKWILHNSFLVEEDGGEKILESIVTDITEKRKIEEKNKFLAGMLDSAPISVIATDKNRRIIYVNPETEKLYGYSSQELIGEDPVILNDDPQREEVEDQMVDITQRNSIYIRRLQNKKKNGQTFIAEISVFQLKDKKGNFVAFVGFQKDVTQEIENQNKIKRSESKFRTIFQKAGAAIFVADPDTGKILDCNQRAEELMQMPRRQLIGIHQSKLHPKGERNQYQKRFKKHVKRDKKADYQGQIEDSKGVVKPIWISADLFNFGDKELMVGFFTDLSERINYEKKEKEALASSVWAEAEHAKAKELEKAYNELKDIQERLIRNEKLAALGQLSGIVAHDLRNPLGVIRNAIYIIKKKLGDLADSKVKKYLQILDEEIETADTIIEDVLSFTRLKNMKISAFNINQEVKRILNKIKIPKNIKLVKKLDKNIPKIKGDKDQLKRVFINLLNNAVEAMPEGGELAISTKLEKNSVLIEISDTGVGIDQEDKNKIFEPMFSTKVHGTGLGLSACKNIIEAHQGKIEIESEKGKGTSFFIKLPFVW